jgi:hypothetical protein
MTANAQVYTLLKNIECTNSQVMAVVAAVRLSTTLQSSFTDSAIVVVEAEKEVAPMVVLIFPT